MAASSSDYFSKVGSPGTATTLSAPGHTTGGTALTVVSTANWPTGTGVIFAIDTYTTVLGEEVRDVGSYTEWEGVVASATSITGLVLREGSDQDYPAGVTTRVYIPVAGSQNDRMVDGLLVEHNQDGTHSDITATTVTADEFIVTGSAGANNGWEVGLPTPDTVTYNGNRSYDLVFNSNDLTDTLSNGMRTRFTRTVTPPTQCTNLESSSSQYWSKTSPAGTTFTDDFCAGAWIKLESYTQGGIITRYNGTSGWMLRVMADGTISLEGFNAGAANTSYVRSYQSVPLNKWVHVAGQLDMSTFTATTTTSYIMIDGVNVPAAVSRGGTNPTALVQAGNLEVGSYNAGTFFDGKIAQAWYSSAKITQATIQGYISQGMTGSETSIVSLFKFNGDGNDSNANANNLTANAGATATTVDSPFNATEYGIITANTFSTNTTLTVQVPEGYAIPTSGGVSAVAYSTQDVPYGFVADKGKWRLVNINRQSIATTSNASYGAYDSGSRSIVIPTGAWNVGFNFPGTYNSTTSRLYINLSSTSLTGLGATAGANASQIVASMQSSAVATMGSGLYCVQPQTTTSATTYVIYALLASVNAGIDGVGQPAEIFAEFNYV